MATSQDNATAVLAARVDHNQMLSTQSDEVHKRIVYRVSHSVVLSIDTGLIENAEPVQVSLKQNVTLPGIRQHPLSQKREGIRPIIQSLLDQVIIVHCPCNTPALPIKTPGKAEY